MTLRGRDNGVVYRVIFAVASLSFFGGAVWVLTGRGDTVATALVLSAFGLFFIVLAGGARGRPELFADNQYVGKAGWFYNRKLVRRYPRGSVQIMRLTKNPLLPSLDFLGPDGRVIFSGSASYTREEIKDFATYLGIQVKGLDDSH
jgi:hypothetical protein